MRDCLQFSDAEEEVLTLDVATGSVHAGVDAVGDVTHSQNANNAREQVSAVTHIGRVPLCH